MPVLVYDDLLHALTSYERRVLSAVHAIERWDANANRRHVEDLRRELAVWFKVRGIDLVFDAETLARAPR